MLAIEVDGVPLKFDSMEDTKWILNFLIPCVIAIIAILVFWVTSVYT